jgi:hypothetical protein
MAIKIGEDGYCMCTCASPCPLNKKGTELRCSEYELREAGIEVIPYKPKVKPPPLPDRLKDCGNSKHYVGIYPPTCNNGKGCDKCRQIQIERLNKLVEMVRRS